MRTSSTAPTRRTRVLRVAAVAFGLCLVAAACSDDDGDGDAATTAAPADTTAATGGDTTAATGGAAAVTAEGFAFDPLELTVPAGTTVTWTNNDGADHTVVGTGISGELPPGGTYEQAFPTAGTFVYACTIHPTMTGTIVVT